ncbi:tRNA (5-methylaminomethyl-2-thiouridine)(34)-methyltransferase MnmD [Elizabethkingia sp. JS20170427COW]|uniref:tRNA (5-methylaminomethyl-2-thiouridine)(34)-methyltransferase MnmD n=1 Tax=Elizabethkingia sp. JS20170427COW TaxID=2583851 RepID=UPI0011109616|nr:tRNA (5-methylaminomethyl-2-thiouridine)(34)-methyltransferase MnmD [Elizabethkingia sp. JS20170427COW]QCX54274.1 tRNA (5-methylaminomethyl-2-thiouridine)(34)-methyltransferase MnmD [Elizabethkingia sp. JS20170427COW]
MERILKTTDDGSKTLYVSSLDETYHSNHGAFQEAKHVFIKNGLNRVEKQEINILELGFGTGLNVLVTLFDFFEKESSYQVNYYSLEKYPLSAQEALSLEHDRLFNHSEISRLFPVIHEMPWEQLKEVSPNFNLKKIEADFFDLDKIDMPKIDLVYFDCFGAKVQPDLWEEPLIKKVADKMGEGGLLTTYSSKGSLQRILKNLNFEVEKLEGPKGKREMINAWKR